MPKKVAQQKKDEPETELVTRRSFIKKIWAGLGVVLFAEFCWVVIEVLRPHRRSRIGDISKSTTIIAGPLERFEHGSVTAFPEGRFYLVRLGNGGFLAIHRKCTHLGCTVPWEAKAQRFVCPCHASAFDITGEVLSPPAPRALDLHPVRIENGIVKVDTGTRIERTSFDPGQVTRP